MTVSPRPSPLRLFLLAPLREPVYAWLSQRSLRICCGHIPVVGEQLVWRNVRITILEATRRRIERVRIEVLDRAAKKE